MEVALICTTSNILGTMLLLHNILISLRLVDQQVDLTDVIYIDVIRKVTQRNICNVGDCTNTYMYVYN